MRRLALYSTACVLIAGSVFLPLAESRVAVVQRTGSWPEFISAYDLWRMDTLLTPFSDDDVYIRGLVRHSFPKAHTGSLAVLGAGALTILALLVRGARWAWLPASLWIAGSAWACLTLHVELGPIRDSIRDERLGPFLSPWAWLAAVFGGLCVLVAYLKERVAIRAGAEAFD